MSIWETAQRQYLEIRDHFKKKKKDKTNKLGRWLEIVLSARSVPATCPYERSQLVKARRRLLERGLAFDTHQHPVARCHCLPTCGGFSLSSQLNSAHCCYHIFFFSSKDVDSSCHDPTSWKQFWWWGLKMDLQNLRLKILASSCLARLFWKLYNGKVTVLGDLGLGSLISLEKMHGRCSNYSFLFV